MPLERTNIDPAICNYLDLHIKLREKRISVYDKTQDFPFNVIKYVSPLSNLHSNVIYGILYSQLIRTARICNHLDDFVNKAAFIIMSYRKRNAERTKMALRIARFVSNYSSLLTKFGLYAKKDIYDLLNQLFALL